MNSTVVREGDLSDVTSARSFGSRVRAITGGYAVIWWTTAALLVVGFAVGGVTVSSLSSILPFASILAVAAVGQTLVIQQRGLDFSVAGSFSLATVVATVVPATTGLGTAGGVVAALAVCALVGLGSGLIVTKLHITPLIATLGVNALLLGLSRTISGASPTPAPDGLTALVNGRVMGIPTIAIIAAVIVGGFAWLIRGTVPGRRLVIVGANPRSARAVGIPAHRYQVGAYALAGLSYGIAGVLFAGYVNTPPINSGDPYLMSTVTAVVIGGTALSGGRASILASAIGALFISILGQIVLALGAPSSVQLLLQGVAIAVAMMIRVVSTITWRRRVQETAAGGAGNPKTTRTADDERPGSRGR